MLKPEKTTLPKTGSRWILFIPDTIRHGNLRAFETFNGSVGRIYCNQANIGEVYSALYLHKSFEKYKEVFSHEPSLTAEVGYTLTRDGRILGAHLIKQSQNE